MKLKVAIAGNPNCGKTTLFNDLAGTHYHVANYPGVTVEKKEATIFYQGVEITFVDLPGTYSLSAYSLEEIVARDYLINEKPDLIVHVVDASNLERNLYLGTQFTELGFPLLIALNMMDVAEARGIKIDSKMLSKNLELRVVETVARKGEGREALLKAIIEGGYFFNPTSIQKIAYGPDLTPVLDDIEKIIKSEAVTEYIPRWLALKYLEGDGPLMEKFSRANPIAHQKILKAVDDCHEHIKSTLDSYPEAIITDFRYGHVASILKGVVTRAESALDRVFISDRIDTVLTHRLAGPFIMLFILYITYKITFYVSEYPIAWLEALFGFMSGHVNVLFSDELLQSLVSNGIIGGVGGVLGFTPLIFCMFFLIALLEDSGYMARVAFNLDKVFKFFGLHGTSVLSYIVSGGIAGGCAVPGVMATRTIKGKKERLLTILTTPFMPCGAKIPVYALLISAFFPHGDKGLLMLLITILSWLLALSLASFLGMFFVKGPPSSFIMELPPYRFPTLKGLTIHAWDRTWMYIKKAATVILAVSIVFWMLMTFPRYDGPLNEQLEHSIAGQVGKAMEPVTKYAGFDWKTNIALIGGIPAKEILVSTLGTAYALADVDGDHSDSLAERLRTNPDWSIATAFSLLIFVMLYSPCLVTLVVLAKESGHVSWAIFTLIGNTLLGIVIAILVYQTLTWILV